MASLPQHVAIVMDGNGRWAKRRGMPRIAGHRAGAKVVRDIVQYAGELGIEALTVFAFSLENRRRPAAEVKFLMSLFLESLERDTPKLNDNNVRLRVIGDHSRFDHKLLRQIDNSQQATQHNDGMTLSIAINYSGRWDIAQATQQVAQAVAAQQLTVDEITPELLQNYLCLNDLPEPDLLIRTGGEQRISNFMLWQFAYTEIFFSPVFWPDFNRANFDEALQSFNARERRFGLTSEQLEDKHA